MLLTLLVCSEIIHNPLKKFAIYFSKIFKDVCTGNQGTEIVEENIMATDQVWDRETMFSQLAKRSPRVVVSR